MNKIKVLYHNSKRQTFRILLYTSFLLHMMRQITDEKTFFQESLIAGNPIAFAMAIVDKYQNMAVASKKRTRRAQRVGRPQVARWVLECWPSVHDVLSTYGISEIYVFGSVLWRKEPRDLDIAVAGCDVNFELDIVEELEELTNKPIHLLLLETCSPLLGTFICQKKKSYLFSTKTKDGPHTTASTALHSRTVRSRVDLAFGQTQARNGSE